MKNLNLTAIFIFGTAIVGGIKAQTIGAWPDASGNPTSAISGTANALFVGVPIVLTPPASALESWAQVRYCKPPLAPEAMGLVVTLLNCNPSGSGSGSPGGVGGDIGPVDPNAPPNEVPLPNYAYLTSVPQINVTYASGPLTGTLPLLAAANGGSNPLIYGRLEEPASSIPGTSIFSPTTFKPRFIVMPAGKTGINIANPRAALDVISTSSQTTATAIFGVNSSHILSAANPSNALGTPMKYSRHIAVFNNLPAAKYSGIVQAGDQALIFTDGAGTDGANTDGALVITPWNSNNAQVGLRMDKDGNSILGGKLEVQGRIMCSGITSKPKWWPDFVFDKDFKLISLDSVEKFILLNKHLPGMPSEKQISLTGIEHTEILQLQQLKIEELTLYTIELMKLITEQKRQLELLNSRIVEVSTK